MLGAGPTVAQSGDGIELTVSEGPGQGEVTLSWTGSGSWYDVFASADSSGLVDPSQRMATVDITAWADFPPVASIRFYEIRTTAETRVAVTPLEPYALLIVDSSGSMTSATGFGPPDCAGATDTKIDHVKCAINSLVNDYGEIALGLGRFRESTVDDDCLNGCTITGVECGLCDPGTGAGCTAAMSSDARLEVLRPLIHGGQQDVRRWVDFVCGTCGDNLALDPELMVAGSGPLAGSLEGARSYYRGSQAADGTVLWPSAAPGFDPIRSDPLATAFLPSGAPCRPYLVISLVDGDESCTVFSSAAAAAAALLTTEVDGSAYRVETKAIGFGKPPGDPQIEGLAHAGGAADVPGVNEGFYPRNAEDLRAALERIVLSAVRAERCNDTDDDCDGGIDEDFPEKGRACTAGGLGACAGTGTMVCRPDGTGTECEVEAPGGSPSTEACNALDDDCDGAADEGCGSCGSAEICGNLVDDDCDGRIDEECQACLDWVDVGVGGGQIMKYEASRPDATPGSAGTVTDSVCSRAGVQPWTNVTRPQADAACATVGARLCGEQEWRRACAAVAPTPYPVVEPAANNGSIHLEAETFAAVSPATASDGVTRAFVPDTAAGYSGNSALRTTPDTGAEVSAANAPSQSPRLDFEITFTQAGNHYVWVRMFETNSAADSIRLGISTIPSVTAPTQSLVASTSGTWVWMRSNAISVTTGTKFVSLYMQEDGTRVDAIYVTRSNSTNAPTAATQPGGRWSYATSPTTYQPSVCNGRDLDTDAATAGNQDDILSTGALAQCYADHFGGFRVYDLSGNVREWTAARMPGVNPICGGASNNEATGTSCDAAATADDGHFAPIVGFRCCR